MNRRLGLHECQSVFKVRPRPEPLTVFRRAWVRRLVFLGWQAWVAVAGAAYFVDFEDDGVTKTSYASGLVTLSGIEWELNEALIGSLAGDKKNGLRALRIRRNGDTAGLAEMQADKSRGIGTISFWYAAYGTDTGQPNLMVEYSADTGDSWIQAGDTITNFPAILTEWSVAVNIAGDARIRLRTDTSGTNQRRINVDDITLSHFDGGMPWVETTALTGITPSTAWGGGEVLQDNDDPVTLRGLVWNTSGSPTTNDSLTAAGSGLGVFLADITNLIAGETYYVRAFAVNSAGSAYGQEHAFITSGFTNAPVLLTITKRHHGGFSAEWLPVPGAAYYLLDIAADDRFHAGGAITLFRDTMGNVTSATSIANHDLAGGFNFSGVHTFGGGDAANFADVRHTSASSGYTDATGLPASGGANVFFSGVGGEYGFCIRGIATGLFGELQLGFAYRKEAASRNATFEVSWSADGGLSWQPMPLSGMPADDEGAGWYVIYGLPLPPEAGNAEWLSLRWVKQGTTAMRIDDVSMRGDGSPPSLHPQFSALPVEAAPFRADHLPTGVWWVRVRAAGAEGILGEPSNAESVNVVRGGTVAVFK